MAPAGHTRPMQVSERSEWPVVIAGGGPVGVTLAMDLTRLGVHSVVLERRHDQPPNQRCNTTNSRSMELLRRPEVGASSHATRKGRAATYRRSDSLGCVSSLPDRWAAALAGALSRPTVPPRSDWADVGEIDRVLRLLNEPKSL